MKSMLSESSLYGWILELMAKWPIPFWTILVVASLYTLRYFYSQTAPFRQELESRLKRLAQMKANGSGKAESPKSGSVFKENPLPSYAS